MTPTFKRIWNYFFKKSDSTPIYPPRAIAKIGDATLFGTAEYHWDNHLGTTIKFTGNRFLLKRPLKDVYKTMGKRISDNKICSIKLVDTSKEWSTENDCCKCISCDLSINVRSNFKFSFTLIQWEGPFDALQVLNRSL